LTLKTKFSQVSVNAILYSHMILDLGLKIQITYALPDEVRLKIFIFSNEDSATLLALPMHCLQWSMFTTRKWLFYH